MIAIQGGLGGPLKAAPGVSPHQKHVLPLLQVQRLRMRHNSFFSLRPTVNVRASEDSATQAVDLVRRFQSPKAKGAKIC